MDEKEYKSTYQNVNPIKCVFEKAINSRVCNCAESKRFNLADREGVSCNSNQAQATCNKLLSALRDNSRFALQLDPNQDRLPHNAEIKIQNGGIKGIVKILDQNQVNESNIVQVVRTALEHFGEFTALPFSEIVRDISAYQARNRRKQPSP